MFTIVRFGPYILDPPGSLRPGDQMELDGIDGFFDEAFAGLDVGDEIVFTVHKISEVHRVALRKEARRAMSQTKNTRALDSALARNILDEVLDSQFVRSIITTYRDDCSVRVAIRHIGALRETIPRVDHHRTTLASIRGRMRDAIQFWSKSRENLQHRRQLDFYLEVPSLEHLELAEQYGCHAIVRSHVYGEYSTLIVASLASDSANAFLVLALGSNDLESSVVIGLPSKNAYLNEVRRFVEEADDEVERAVWMSLL